MDLTSIFAISLALFSLALIPGPGVMMVISRTLSHGLKGGCFAVLGVVAGDSLFVLLAVFGLAALSQVLGGFFLVVKYLGAAYLIWLGLRLLLTQPAQTEVAEASSPELRGGEGASFGLGLLTTLGNPKAILFYASFFPAFVDIASLTATDVAVILALVAGVIGGVTFTYAWIAHRGTHRLRKLRLFPGLVLMGSGAWLALRDSR